LRSSKKREERAAVIKDRWYKPSGDELIYHYTPPNSFLEIVGSGKIWASASYTLNDVSERSWGFSIFERAVKVLESEVGDEYIKRIAEPVVIGYLHSLLMVACFSLDADVLSQWRAYADDASGFAIGFSPKLMQMPAKPLRVLYDEDAQTSELVGNLKHTYEVEKSSGFKYGEQFQKHMFGIGMDLCAYKNPSFKEEREIRFAHLCGMVGSKKIIALGARGSNGKPLSDQLETHFRMRKGVIVPYVVIDYSRNGTVEAIKEVVLGPKNENDEDNVETYLNTIGISNVIVRRSKVPYR
jgi:hypothetical protein